MTKYIIQLGTSTILFLLFTFCTWYEGTEIMDVPWEWKYSAHFSGGEKVTDQSMISTLDYFVYAAKFKPLFPSLMALTALHLFLLISWLAGKRQKKRMAAVLFTLTGGLFLSSVMLFDSPTQGGTVFWLFGLIGSLGSAGAGVCLYLPKRVKEA